MPLMDEIVKYVQDVRNNNIESIKDYEKIRQMIKSELNIPDEKVDVVFRELVARVYKEFEKDNKQQADKKKREKTIKLVVILPALTYFIFSLTSKIVELQKLSDAVPVDYLQVIVNYIFYGFLGLNICFLVWSGLNYIVEQYITWERMQKY